MTTQPELTRPAPNPDEERFPLDELTRACAIEYGWNDNMTRVNCRASGHKWHWLQAYGVSVDEADNYAIRCGMHPTNVWGDKWILDDALNIDQFDQMALL